MAKIAVGVVQIAQRQGWLDRLKDSLRRKHQVLVLGSTGVGKSQLLSSLRDLVPQVIDHMARTEWPSDERIKLGKEIFVFKDTPGQKGHQSPRTKGSPAVPVRDFS